MKQYAIASDHAGILLKEELKKEITNFARVTDLGVLDGTSVDYPDQARALANHFKANPNTIGVLICGTGIGMSIAINRYPHIRAALCGSIEEAELSRRHNNANVLVLGARILKTEGAKMIVKAFDNADFEGDRHEKRVAKINANSRYEMPLMNTDPEIFAAIQKELDRQQNCIELIASENIVSRAVLDAQGSVMTNKYAEGYAGKRYYGGCQFVDIAENLAIERLKKLYGCNFANVQPHSGSQANQAVYAAMLSPGDTILGMSLDSGGHLTHGARVNLSGKWFNAVQYAVDQKTGLIDYGEVERIALECKPKLIIAGGSAYPRTIDFAKFREIADKVSAYLMVDMAHFSGLVAGGVFPNPVLYAHFVTSTTHKTLRGPRGGIILTNDEELAKKINSAIFPGIQGGPLMHVIAAKAVAFGEALDDSFKAYAKNVVANAKEMAEVMQSRGYAIFTGGTDCHLLLVDLRPKAIKGIHAEKELGRAGITCNKNAIPFDTEKPFVTSGIRIGSAAGTSRGFMKQEFALIAKLIADILDTMEGKEEADLEVVNRVNREVLSLCEKFPIYTS